MAWGGKFGRMTVKQRAYFLRHSNRRLPEPDNPNPQRGVPTSVMKILAAERLPPDRGQWNARLQFLLRAYKLNGG